MKYIKREQRKSIEILSINKPEVLNALDGEVLSELEEAVDAIAENTEARALIITGEGRAFAAGADIAAQSVLDTQGGRRWGQKGSAIFRKIELLEIPTIAAVNGFALGGGCELALSCDLILASEKAKFGQPEVGLGITPGFSGTQRLPRRIGVGKAKEMIFTGEIVRAEEAERIGLANKVIPAEKLMEEAVLLAEKMIGNGPIAVKYSKAAIDRGLDVDIDTGIRIENELFAMCFATEDQKEGMKAFLEKRNAEFVNK
ncbi:enoyl-CoA hydratase-related protein [Anaerovorax odorimutans]|uniref:Enoyl-CoA hydratase-related protein n=1 Tax=Anaerovorax odorimutans TaxID=109327 RepID=A0ABT1RNX7_9FIRM|nr:enoyl-CoA hydratase-related protein [Anaerovorax odorimutans]MCQ4636895.1 enoyl-CoA hydratase-related protein [Anaerovorax odorimutans]